MKYLIGVILSFTIFLQIGFAANTVYVDGSAANDSGNGTINTPKKYITSGIALMNGGDTLVIKDGVYTGVKNAIGDYASPQVWPPNGLDADHYTIIKAEHVGGVILDGEYQMPVFSTANRSSKVNYVRIEGIHFRRGSVGVFNIKGDYNKVIRCGFEDGQSPTSEAEVPIAFIAGGSSYSLVEDCWVWGKGRYGFYTSSTDGGTNHIIFRRVVVRQDDTPKSHVCAGIRFYNADTNVAQNCIVVDSTPDPESSEFGGAFAMGGGASSGEPNHSFYGVIALNNSYYPGISNEKSTGTMTVENSVFWNNGSFGFAANQTGSGTLTFNKITVGSNALSGFRSNNGYGSIENISNSISVNNGGFGFLQIDSADTVNVFGNTSGEATGSSLTHKIITSPFIAAGGFSNPALKYLVRIEDNSNLKGAATDGGDIGANIIKKIGVSGTLYGEAGWNQVTDQDLWPFPDESIWIPKIKSYSASGPGGNRGFAADGTTLTSYIWNYLGNYKPQTLRIKEIK